MEFSELSTQRKASYENYSAVRNQILEWTATKSKMAVMIRTTDKKSIVGESDDDKKGTDSRSFFMGFWFSQKAKFAFRRIYGFSEKYIFFIISKLKNYPRYF